MINAVKIAGRDIGRGAPCFVIAEAGVNHNGDIATAHALIEAAVTAGADAIKFQSFITEELVTDQARKADYQAATTGGSNSQFEMLKALELDSAQHSELKNHCDDAGILYLCTPYDRLSLDAIDSIGAQAFKIASTDTTNTPLLKQFAAKKRPVILSTGMCSLGEVERAVQTLQGAGLGDKIILLQCTSEYPAPMEDVNLRAMQTMEQAFCCPVGFSDHTAGIGASPWAVAMGACLVEKHFTLDRTMKGPDHRASIEPEELAVLVQTVRNVERALGDGRKRVQESEQGNKERMQKSLVAARDIKTGQPIEEQDLTCKRPGGGMPPYWHDRVVGRVAQYDVMAGSVLPIDAVQWGAESD